MKTFISVTLVVVVTLTIGCKEVKQPVEYGSNNGTFVTINNTEIYYEEYGEGMPLILLQGGLGSIADFRKCIPGLAKQYRVIAPDTPGQGRSSLADSMSYPLIADYISKLIDQLKIDSTYVMGWSDGGIVGLLLAENRPDKVKRVLAVAANYNLKGAFPLGTDISEMKPMPLEAWEANNQAWIDNYLKMGSQRDWKKLRGDLTKMWYQEEYFPKTLLERITIPVLVATGDSDDINLEHSIEMYRAIPRGQFCVLPQTSHYVFEEQPDLISTIAVHFFGAK